MEVSSWENHLFRLGPSKNHGYVTNNQMVIPYFFFMIFPYKTIFFTFPWYSHDFPSNPLIWPLDFQHHNLSRLHHAMARLASGLTDREVPVPCEPSRERPLPGKVGTFYARKRGGKTWRNPQFSQQFSRISCTLWLCQNSYWKWPLK